MQCPQINPMTIVPTIPTPHPELEKANGPAKRPDPSEALIILAVALTSLKNKDKYKKSLALVQ